MWPTRGSHPCLSWCHEKLEQHRCWLQRINYFEKLKKHLISLYRPNIRSTFDIHNPQLRYIFQLRVGLSHLLHYKKSHHFTDTPSDKCLCKKGVEDTNHFLITCPFYITPRSVLISIVENLLQRHNLTVTNFGELLLYGHPSLDESENRIIILATLEFINQTKRFSKWFDLIPFPCVAHFFLTF